MDGIDEIVREFLIESNENLDQLDQDLVALESNPGSRDLLSSIFRTIHTIKGTSGFLALTNLERVAHVGENLLVELRDGKRVMDMRTTNVLLLMVDTIRALLDQIDATGDEAGVEVDKTVSTIQNTLDGIDEPSPDSQTGAAAQQTPVAEQTPVDSNADPASTRVETADSVSVERADNAGGTQSITTRSLSAVLETGAPPAEATTPQTLKHSADSSIRVDVGLLDELMRQVGELVLVRNHIAQLAGFDSGELLRSSQRLSLIASELQDGVMKTRMQPIDHIWAKMPRVVRDLSAACGREVQLDMIGGETELDRSLLEAVKDPLTHLIRNAVDHGIESPTDREAAGKPRVGTLTLRAYHAGGQVVVEVNDDGAGLDPEKIAAKALERNLKTVDQLRLMSDSDIQNLVFSAGFSTSSAVTNISGRGVGMDVVRSNIEEIGGVVELESQVGKGTTWRLRIPLTLAIMQALTVTVGDEIYAIPQVSVQELVALDTQKTQEAIETIGGCEVYRLRGGLLPLVRLPHVLEHESRNTNNTVIVVLQSDNQRFGLIVDRVLDNQEIVVKPLSTILKTIGVYAGATLMGDGQVALILDTAAIARRELKADVVDALVAQSSVGVESVGTATEYLVVGVGNSPRRRVAIALSQVTRLEKVQLADLELVGGRNVMQYRGDIVPVQWLGSALGVFEQSHDDEKPTIIFTRGSRTLALIVDEILEITDDSGTVASPVSDSGLMGSLVLNGTVSEILDTESVLRSVDPNFFDNADEAFDFLDSDSVLAGF